MLVAMQMVNLVTTIVIEMVVPGIVGHWLDDRWGTRFLALTGLALGVSVGVLHLLALSRRSVRPATGVRRTSDAGETPDEQNRPARN